MFIPGYAPGSESQDVIDRRLLDVDPHMHARIVSMRGRRVRIPGRLGVDNEPGLDRVQVAKRGKHSAFPRGGHVANRNEVDERHVHENSL